MDTCQVIAFKSQLSFSKSLLYFAITQSTVFLICSCFNSSNCSQWILFQLYSFCPVPVPVYIWEWVWQQVASGDAIEWLIGLLATEHCHHVDLLPLWAMLKSNRPRRCFSRSLIGWQKIPEISIVSWRIHIHSHNLKESRQKTI